MAKQQITGNFEWRMPPTVIPAFVSGADAKRLYGEVSKTVKSGVWYDAGTKTMQGSDTPLVARVDSIVRPLGIRVANLRDLSRPEVMEMAKDNFYIDAPELVLRSTADSYSPNQAIIETLTQAVEGKEGSLKLPLKVTGFDVVKADNEYGWNIVPRDYFAIVHDERLGSRYNGRTFNDVDELGLPNFDRRGSRTWYARGQGVSRLYLSRNLNLGSDNEDLADSNEYGRVVLVRAEGTAPDEKAQK